jgi:hypothetical protein
LTKQTHEPGPGRTTADAAFAEVTREIAKHNERFQEKARKVRTAREQEQIRQRRQRDLR